MKMRDYKFRVWNKDIGMSEPCGFYDLQIMDMEGLTDITQVHIMQYTGLHDATKWEQLSADEKQKFYNEHRSEDGKTIKYCSIDDVKHLWMGREICEGDIIKSHYVNAKNADFIECVVFHNGRFAAEKVIGTTGKMWALLADGVPHLPQDKSLYMESCEVIGNIFENPELIMST